MSVTKTYKLLSELSIGTGPGQVQIVKCSAVLPENRMQCWKAGDVLVEYKNKKLLYTIYEERPLQAEEVSSKELNSKLDDLFKKNYKPSKKHPWKKGFAPLPINT